MITLTMLIILLIFSKLNKSNRDTEYFKASYRGLATVFNRLSQIILPILLNTVLGRRYLMWHRLLYSNAQVDMYLELTLSKMFIHLLIGSCIWVDLFLGNAEAILLIIVFFMVCLMTILPISSMKKQYDECSQEILRELPRFVQQMALLIKSGMNAKQSIDIIYKHSASSKGLNTLLNHVYLEHASGNDLFQSFGLLNELMHHKSIHHLSLLMGQVKRSGVHQVADQLIALAEMMMSERQNYIRIASEQLSTKLLMPMMISMMTILALLMYPIMVQMS